METTEDYYFEVTFWIRISITNDAYTFVVVLLW